MLSQVCVCLVTGGGPHVTITLDALDLKVQVPCGPESHLDIRPEDPKSGGNHWGPVPTCSLDLTGQGPHRPSVTSGGH